MTSIVFISMSYMSGFECTALVTVMQTREDYSVRNIYILIEETDIKEIVIQVGMRHKLC